MLAGEGTTVGLSFWESRDVAARHRVARMQFIERMTSIAGVEIEQMEEFELAFAELSARLTNPWGVEALESDLQIRGQRQWHLLSRVHACASVPGCACARVCSST